MKSNPSFFTPFLRFTFILISLMIIMLSVCARQPGHQNPGITTEKPETEVLSASSSSKPDTSSVVLPDINDTKAVPVQKGRIPEVKFTSIDPCAPQNMVSEGTPWEPSSAKILNQLPSGIEAVIPPPIPDLDKLSDFNYHAAVSVAFEGMRLIYGAMPDEEARKFEAVWAPLFDFPTQEIIDYLNRLNPLISQFLAVREVYVSNLQAVTMVLLDAG